MKYIIKPIQVLMKTAGLAIGGGLAGAVCGAASSALNGTPVMHGLAMGAIGGLTGVLTSETLRPLTGNSWAAIGTRSLVSGIAGACAATVALDKGILPAEAHDVIQYASGFAAVIAAVKGTYHRLYPNKNEPDTTKEQEAAAKAPETPVKPPRRPDIKMQAAEIQPATKAAAEPRTNDENVVARVRTLYAKYPTMGGYGL